MSRKDVLIIILILTISIGLLTVSEGICLIYTGDNNFYNNLMPTLDWTSSLTGTFNYIIDVQMPLNTNFGLVNLFNSNLFNNGTNHIGNFQTNNYPGSWWSSYSNNLVSMSNVSNFQLGGLDMFNYGWGINNILNFPTNPWNKQYVLPNFSNITPITSVNPLTNPSYSMPNPQLPRKKLDDWKYNPGTSTGSGSTGSGVFYGGGGLYGGYSGGSSAYSSAAYSYTSLGTSTSSASYSSSSNIGYSTGGAKDVNNFRENINNDFLPIPTDITYEGLFYDYFFDTGQQEECLEKFCPSYCPAETMEPFSEETEYFLSVGLNSGIKKEDFQRKKLNLVIVLDISGSMGSAFNQYYYDQFGNQQSIEADDIGKRKITIATETIVDLLDQLRDDDRFGMVLFESVGYLAKSFRLVGDTDMKAIKKHITIAICIL